MLPSPVDAIVLETFFNTTSSIETTIKKQSRSSTAFWEIKKRKYKHIHLMLLFVGLRLLVEFGQSLNEG
jgi:hypothetical protein